MLTVQIKFLGNNDYGLLGLETVTTGFQAKRLRITETRKMK